MKAVIYIRVSTEEQTKNYSLDLQKKECLRYAKANGWNVIAEYREEGVSAKTVYGRPKLKELIHFCMLKQNKGIKIIVYKLDRWSRDTAEGLGAISLLAKNGAEVVSVTEPTGSSAMGKAVRGFMLVFAQFDNDQKSERTTKGMKAAFEAGNWIWQAPIGYLSRKSETGKNLHLRQEYKSMLSTLFTNASTGNYTKKELADQLNKQGFSDLYGRPATEKIIDKILQKKIYFGVMEAKSWGIEHMGNHAPVTDENTWLKARQAIYHIPAYNKSKNMDELFPLRRFILCNSCKHPLTGSFSTGRKSRYSYYHCAFKDCTSPARMASKALEDKFIEYLHMFTLSAIQRKLLKAVLVDKLDARVKQQEQYAQTLKKKIDDINTQRKNIANANAKGIYTDSEAIKLADELRAEEAVYSIELSERKFSKYEAEAVINFADHFLSDVGHLWRELDIKRKQFLQQRIFPEKVYFDGEKFGTATLAPSFELITAMAQSSDPLVNYHSILTNQIIDEFIGIIKDWQLMFSDFRTYLTPAYALAQ